MCVVSNVGDDWTRQVLPTIWPPQQPIPSYPVVKPIFVPREDFDRLKEEVEQLKKRLEEAHAYDVANDEPNCHMDEKVQIIRKIAEALGVDLGEVFGTR